MNARIILAKFQSTALRIAVNIIQCYTPANDAEDQDQEWISPETLIRKEERKKLKNVLNNGRTRAVKQPAGEAYTRTNREVKRSETWTSLQQKQRKLQIRITSNS